MAAIGQLQDAITKQFGVSGGDFEQSAEKGGLVLYAAPAVLANVKSWFNEVKSQYPGIGMKPLAGSDAIVFTDTVALRSVNPQAPDMVVPSPSGEPGSPEPEKAGTPGGGDLAVLPGGKAAGESVRKNLGSVVEAILRTKTTGEVRRVLESQVRVRRNGGRMVVEGVAPVQGGRRLSMEARKGLQSRLAAIRARRAGK